MKTRLLPLSLLSLFWAHESTAAEFSYRPLANGNQVIELAGEITPGDSDKLRSLIAKDPSKFLSTTSLSLRSPGGSVSEAVKISEQLRNSGLAVAVERDQVCASSCFLIWVAADFRVSFSTSHIIIHRPYLPTDTVTVKNFKEKSLATGRVLSAMRQYLTEQNVSSSLIDKMMRLPSSEGYELTVEDRTSIGVMSPVIEEKAIKFCGVSNSTILVSATIKEATLCVGDIHRALSLPFLVELIGVDRATQANERRVANAGSAPKGAPPSVAIPSITNEKLPSESTTDQQDQVSPVDHASRMYFGCALAAARKLLRGNSTATEVTDAALSTCSEYYFSLLAAETDDLKSIAGRSIESLQMAEQWARDGTEARKRAIRERVLQFVVSERAGNP